MGYDKNTLFKLGDGKWSVAMRQRQYWNESVLLEAKECFFLLFLDAPLPKKKNGGDSFWLTVELWSPLDRLPELACDSRGPWRLQHLSKVTALRAPPALGSLGSGAASAIFILINAVMEFWPKIPFLANLHNITASLKSIFCWLVFFIDHLTFRKFSWKWT